MILDSLKSFERYITLHERFGKVYTCILWRKADTL